MTSRSTDAGQALELVPIYKDDAFRFVVEHHRHHEKPPVGYLWAHALTDSEGR